MSGGSAADLVEVTHQPLSEERLMAAVGEPGAGGPVLFPGVVAPLDLGRPQSIAGAQAAARADKPIGVVLQKDVSIDTPGPEHLIA